MDSFLSESFTSISSASSDIVKPEKPQVQKCKIRATGEFKPFEQTDFENYEPIVKIKRHDLSFLPKVDDLYMEPSISNYQPQLDDSKYAKKVAAFKIKKLKIVSSLMKSTKKRKLSKAKRKLQKQPENTTENVRKKMSLKLKKAKGVWRSVTDLENFDEKPRLVNKELYIKLVPLEKTNLLTKEQIHQLENRKIPKTPCKNVHKSNKTNGSTSRKNKTKLSVKLESNIKKNNIYTEYYRPCKVILERLTSEQINLYNNKKSPMNSSDDTNKSQYNKRIRKKLFKKVDKASPNFGIFKPTGNSSPLKLIKNSSKTRSSRYSLNFKTCKILIKKISGISPRRDSSVDSNLSQNEPDESELDQNLTYTVNDASEFNLDTQNSTFTIETSDCNDNVVDNEKSSANEICEISTTSNISLEESDKINDLNCTTAEKKEYDSVLTISDEQIVSSSGIGLLETEGSAESKECGISEDADADESTVSVAVKPTRIFTPKSMLKTKRSGASVKSNRKVTFSNMSVIIIDDSDVSYGSPVPTLFPPDEDVASCTESQLETVTRSPLRTRTHNVSVKSSEKYENKNDIRKYVMRSQLKNTPKLTKMPDFTKIHKKLFDKMLNIEEYNQRKSQRAQFLLLGRSVSRKSSSPSKNNKEYLNKSAKKEMLVKKQIKYPSGQVVKNVSKNPNSRLSISSRKAEQNEANGCNRYGFKITHRKNITKKDQINAFVNKTKPTNLKVEDKRVEIKGVRCNRRFELLMKMRDKKHK